MNIVTTPYDVETYVIARLGELRDDHDIAGIVAGIRETEWWPVPDRPVTTLDEIPGLSAIIEQHDLRPRDGGPQWPGTRDRNWHDI